MVHIYFDFFYIYYFSCLLQYLYFVQVVPDLIDNSQSKAVDRHETCYRSETSFRSESCIKQVSCVIRVS